MTNIDSWITHFQTKREQISALGNERHHYAFKKTLYLTVLDTLAGCVYPHKGPKDRFILFISRFGEWADAQRVSLSHLVALLTRAPGPEFSSLRRFARQELSNWSDGRLIELRQDPSIEDVRRYWPRDIASVTGVKLEELQHVRLLYRLRNVLVHEGREPGYGMETTGDIVPYYMNSTALESGVTSWELVYPVPFFELLYDRCLARLAIYLIEDQINPRDSYRFGTYWIEELNIRV